MDKTIATLMTFAIAAGGGALFNLIGIPLPWMLGALTVCMLASQIVPSVHVPKPFREVLQPILGVSLGSYFTPSLLDEFSRWPEVLGVLVAYIVVASLFGLFYFRRVAGFDQTTSFFSAVPGGLSDLTLVGASMGANIVLLGLIHSIRVLMVVIAMPLVVSLVSGPVINMGVRAATTIGAYDLAVLIVCGVVGYAAGRLLRIPAGAMLGPLLVSAGVHMMDLSRSSPPGMLIIAVQIVLGAYIGVRFVGLQWHEFRSALFHGIVWASGLIAISVAAAFLGTWATGFGLPQLLLAFAPGGITEMGLLTLSLGIDVALVTTCHVVRILLIYMLVPIVAWRVASKGASVKDDTGLTDD